MEPEQIRQEVTRISPWHHRINLGHGIITPGGDDSPAKLKKLGMADDLRGMTVLDIGAWDGFFSFEAERRGASRVVALDSFSWNGPGPGTKAGFELARRVFDSRVEDVEMDLFDMSPEKIGTFDLVLFLGVLYHMRHPLLSLEKVASVTGKHLILETALDLCAYNRPAMVFYPASELKGDATNWWGPNPAAVEAMLRDVGFRTVKMVAKDSLPYRMARAVRWKRKTGAPFIHTVQGGRGVFHAWR
jgi:tRNA (mo5U34)-methyltransferase